MFEKPLLSNVSQWWEINALFCAYWSEHETTSQLISSLPKKRSPNLRAEKPRSCSYVFLLPEEKEKTNYQKRRKYNKW